MQLRYGLPAELVVARGIPFRTVRGHHLLPFSGLAHGGYLPGEHIIGQSRATTSRPDPGHGPGISRVRGTAGSATLIRSTSISTPGGHHEHH
jgi:hypothetical protein